MSEHANERFRALSAKKSELESQLAEARAMLEAANNELNSWQTKGRQWGQERAFLSVGITDPEVQEMALFVHGRLGEDAPDLADWLQAEDGARSHAVLGKALAGLQQAPAAPAPAAEPRTPPPTAEAGAAPAPAPSGGDRVSRYNDLLRKAAKYPSGHTERVKLEKQAHDVLMSRG